MGDKDGVIKKLGENSCVTIFIVFRQPNENDGW